MFLKTAIPFLLLSSCLLAQEEQGRLELDFLGSYYDQSGEHSPVNGGNGSEELTSASPVIAVRFTNRNDWKFSANLGFDSITSASIDSMDENAGPGHNVSGASGQDTRAFLALSAEKRFGNQTWGTNLGFSNEYDYHSLYAGFNWALDFNERNTTLGLALTHYSDTVDQYDINGVNQGEEDRTTTDLSVTLSQVLGRRTVMTAELFASDQSGFLSSPFQEVILSDGTHVAEKLPDARLRTGLRLSLNQAWSAAFVTRFYYRYYTDDIGIDAHSLEIEPHFRLPTGRKTWLYPILRYHTQTGSDHYGLPNSFNPADPFYTADRDLSEFTSTKLGLGLNMGLSGGHLRSLNVRLSHYERDEGLSAFTLSFGFGWSFL